MPFTNGVVLDLGWLTVFRDIDEPSSPNQVVAQASQHDQSTRDAIFSHVMSDVRGAGLSDLLLFAEHLVVNEFFVVDELALDARLGQIPREIAAYVQRRRPPEAVYSAAADAVLKLARGLWESSGNSEALTQLLEEITAEAASQFWSSEDKQLHEFMARSNLAMSLVASAASTGGDTLSRVLFYLEYGRHLGDVPLLGPGKRRWLQHIGQRMQSSIHDVITKKFDDAVLGTITGELSDAFAPSRMRSPPVAELVLKKAIAEGITILESAAQIREAPEALDYRDLLQELRTQLGRGRSGMLDAQRAIAGLDKIAKSWGERSDVQVGISYRPRTISFEKLPLIGDLLKAADMSKAEIRDRILNAPPGYLAFISTWYRDQPTASSQ